MRATSFLLDFSYHIARRAHDMALLITAGHHPGDAATHSPIRSPTRHPQGANYGKELAADPQSTITEGLCETWENGPSFTLGGLTDWLPVLLAACACLPFPLYSI
jgi:hypothetical protein